MDHKGQSKNNLTILHVEDDQALVKLVQAAFLIFGFRGNMLVAGRVQEALDLLIRRAQAREPINLILVGMRLPDGTGLEVIHKVKSDPRWRRTPVIVLSSELAPGTINAAYALGANCFLSKEPKGIGFTESLRALFGCWLQQTELLPQPASYDRLQDALRRSIYLRARTAEFYLNLARAFEGTAEMLFWLDRSLNEGNLSNLFAFLLPKVTEKDLPTVLVERLHGMQVQVQQALDRAENALKRTPVPRPVEAYAWALDVVAAINEEVVAMVMGALFPKGPEATTALRIRAAIQMKELSCHILEQTDDQELHQKAEVLRDWAQKMAAENFNGSSTN